MVKNLQTLTTSTVKAVEDKNASNVAAANSALESKIIETVIPQVIKDQVGVEITDLATKAEVAGAQAAVDGKLSEMYLTKEAIQNGYATKSYAAGQAMTTASDFLDAGLNGTLSYLWKNLDIDNMDKGYFYTKKINKDGSYALIFNEADGGGSQFWNYTKDILSYVGVNEGDQDGICVQIYSKYKGETSNNIPNNGVRINVNPNGAYYTKGADTTATGGVTDNGREIAVKENIDELKALIKSLSDRVTALEQNA